MDILLDLDGVIADLEPTMWAHLAKHHPECPQVAPENRRGWLLEEQLGDRWAKAVFSMMLREGFFASLEPVRDAIAGVEFLSRSHNVTICTAPMSSPYCAKEKFEWVQKYLGTDHATRMIVTKDKTLIRGDFLLDDKPVIKGSMMPVWEHVLFDTVCTRHMDLPQMRVNWQQILNREFKFAFDLSTL